MPQIRIYGQIGGDLFGQGITPEAFAAQLPKDGSPVELRINSPGGSVLDGFAIANQILSYPGETVAVVEGEASSAASYIAVAAKKTVMFRASVMLIHAPHSATGGTASELRDTAEKLDKLAEGMRALYKRKGIADAQIDEWFSGPDFLLTPDEAKAAGLIDEIIDEPAKISAHRRQFLAKRQTKRGYTMDFSGMTKKELRARYKAACSDEEKQAIAKHLAEKEDTTTGDGMEDKVKANADEDPSVQALKAELFASKETLAQLKAEREAAEAARANEKIERDFVAMAGGKLEAERALELIRDQGHNLARAQKVLDLIPARQSSIFSGGSPKGAAPKAGAMANKRETGLYVVYGMRFSDLVTERMKAKNIKYHEAFAEIGREQPELLKESI